jgi:8-oxo-dGTP diphosphatase
MYTPTVETLGYVLSHDKKSILMIHRNKRLDDVHYGKYNGLGGKIHNDETVTEGMKRELLEESGLHADNLILRGVISWPGFGKKGEDSFGFIYIIDQWHGEKHEGNHEGTLEWVPLDKVLELPLWPGDLLFLPMVFDDNPRPFYGHMPYKEGKMVSWRYDR